HPGAVKQANEVIGAGRCITGDRHSKSVIPIRSLVGDETARVKRLPPGERRLRSFGTWRVGISRWGAAIEVAGLGAILLNVVVLIHRVGDGVIQPRLVDLVQDSLWGLFVFIDVGPGRL